MKYSLTIAFLAIFSLGLQAQNQKPELTILTGINDFKVINRSGFSQSYYLYDKGRLVQRFILKRNEGRRMRLNITKNNIKRYTIKAVYDENALLMDKKMVAYEMSQLRSRRQRKIRNEFILRTLDGWLANGAVSTILRTGKTIGAIRNGATQEEKSDLALSWGVWLGMKMDKETPKLVKSMLSAGFALRNDIINLDDDVANERIILENYLNACYYKFFWDLNKVKVYNLSTFIDMYPRLSVGLVVSKPLNNRIGIINGVNYNRANSPVQIANFPATSNLSSFSFEWQNRLHFPNRVKKKQSRLGLNFFLHGSQSGLMFSSVPDPNFPLGIGYVYKNLGIDYGVSYRFLGANRPQGVEVSFLSGLGLGFRSNIGYDTPIPSPNSRILIGGTRFDHTSARLRMNVLFDLRWFNLTYDAQIQFSGAILNRRIYFTGKYSILNHSVGIGFPLAQKLQPAPDYGY